MKTTWSKIQENLEKMLDPGIYQIWVARLQASIDAPEVNLCAPNQFMAEWIKRHLEKPLRQACGAVLGLAADQVRLSFSVGDRSEKGPDSSAGLVKDVLRAEQAVLPVRQKPLVCAGRWHFNFEDFVTGPSNEFAVAAARDMCQTGSVRTLFVTSAPGLGKTHLTQAAGCAITKSSPLKVCYLTAEQFASRYVAAMRSRELEDFKQYLCGMDALLLEDIHFLQRKKAMQEMILSIIKNLQEKGARVILTSSFTPRQLQEMDGQLISQFCSGILASMEKPDMEMRREILKRKAKYFQVALPDEVCDMVSRRLSSDVRQLESCLKSMIFKARLMNSGLNVEMALETLGQYAGAETGLDAESIVRLVCESFGLTEKQLRSKSRKQEYVNGRNTAFYLARKHTEMSLEEIGCIFNRRHSTVMRGITQVEQEMAADSRSGRQFARAVAMIERKCGFCS